MTYVTIPPSRLLNPAGRTGLPVGNETARTAETVMWRVSHRFGLSGGDSAAALDAVYDYGRHARCSLTNSPRRFGSQVPSIGGQPVQIAGHHVFLSGRDVSLMSAWSCLLGERRTPRLGGRGSRTPPAFT